MRVVVVALAWLVASCNDGEARKVLPWIDASYPDASAGCAPLTQQGCQASEKCSWIIDATEPQYTGRIGCAPDGHADFGSACSYYGIGPSDYDDCRRGSICSAYAAPGTQGICKEICDLGGGNPFCFGAQMCVAYPNLFTSGAMSPTAAGVCDPS